MTVQIVSVNLAGPVYKFTKQDRVVFEQAALGADPDLPTEQQVKVRVSIGLLQALVNAKYARGMDGKDARLWGGVLDHLADEPETLELTGGQFEWLYRIVIDDEVQVDAQRAHWRVALDDYWRSVKDEMKRQERTPQPAAT